MGGFLGEQRTHRTLGVARRIPPGKRRSMKVDSHRRSVGPMAASAAPQTRRCGKRLRAPGGSSDTRKMASSGGAGTDAGHLDAPNRTPGLAKSDSTESCGLLPQSGMNRRSTQQPTKNRAIAVRRRNQSASPHPDRRLRSFVSARFLSFAELAIGFSQAPSCHPVALSDAKAHGGRRRGEIPVEVSRK
jgi:hypothetical protein